MQIERHELMRSIAEMAYAIAKADRGLSAEERIAFYKIIKEELDFESWAAESRFELLDEIVQPSIESAYKDAMHDFKKYKDFLTQDIKEKTLRVMQKVAEACNGLNEKETDLLERFRREIEAV